MNLFGRRKKFTVNAKDPEYKVFYLGNVQTTLMKGEGVEKPVKTLWEHHFTNGGATTLKMTLQVCSSGLRALTASQEITDYSAHRICYFASPEGYPRLFVWVYRHEGRKLQPELRCHAVLCRRAEHAQLLTVQLDERLQTALREFKREKARQHRQGVPIRLRLLRPSRYKPPVAQSFSQVAKLTTIGEDQEEEAEGEQQEDEVPIHYEVGNNLAALKRSLHESEKDKSFLRISGTHSDEIPRFPDNAT